MFIHTYEHPSAIFFCIILSVRTQISAATIDSLILSHSFYLGQADYALLHSNALRMKVTVLLFIAGRSYSLDLPIHPLLFSGLPGEAKGQAPG